MSQQIRLEYPGSLWHVTVRGNGRREIFRDDVDRHLFLGLLGKCVSRSGWILSAYVLMPSEFRLLIKLTTRTLSRGMQWLNSTYAQKFNRRRCRVGHLVHGRFQGCLVEEQVYFKDVIRDVVLSPVHAGLVSKPEDFAWSSHRAILDRATGPQWLAIDNVLSRFGGRGKAPENYRAFVDAGVRTRRDPFDHVVGGIYLGTEAWMCDVRKLLSAKLRSNDRSRLQRTLCTLTMADVIAAVAGAWSTDTSRIRHGRGGVPRMVAAWIASTETLITHREIATALCLNSSARVTRLIRDCDRALDGSVRLRTFVDRSVATLRRKM